MRLIYFFIPVISCFQIKQINKPNLKLFSKPNENKLPDYLSLIRYKNILPTILLNISGGLIMSPSIHLLSSIPFIVSIINTFLISSSSMIINDLYDIEIDKINNPTRPLVTGNITIREAKYLIVGLLGLTEILTFMYLNNNLNLIIQFAIINILIYTPILKKITLIKNISCALLISFAPIFSGLSIKNNSLFNLNHNYNLLFDLGIIIFLGSLYCEVLLDIRDCDGDKKYNIKTIPVLFGNDKAFYFICTILFCIISFTFIIEHNNGLLLVYRLIIFDLYKVKTSNYSYDMINKASSNTNYYLLTFILIHLINVINFL
jgi:geranylgeranylglycerol-phosphate geranylgeranyltransferase